MGNHTRLDTGNIDHLGAIVLSLLSELWVTRDRLAIVEKLLVERGGLHAGEVDDYIPEDEFAGELETMRNRLVTEVMGAPLLTPGMGVDALLERVGLQRPEHLRKVDA